MSEGIRRRLRRSRRGAAILVVLLLVTITLALSYSLMRSQGTALQIRGNADLRAQARNAAYLGMRKAIEHMKTRQWQGVKEYAGDERSKLLGSVNAQQRYEVTFTTGDAALCEGHPDRDEYAFRVTLFSTGFASDAADPSREASYRIEAVVRLVPERLSPQLTGWPELTGYTLSQWTSGTFSLNVPFRIEGPVRAQQRIDLAKSSLWLPWYFWFSEEREAYLLDLGQMGGNVHQVLAPSQEGQSPTIVSWTVPVGRIVTVGDEIAKVQAGETLSSVRATATGVLSAQLAGAGQAVPTGQAMAEITRSPYLPFTGRLCLPRSSQEEYKGQKLLEAMGIPLQDKAATTVTTVAVPTDKPTYQLYPGGKVYASVTLPADISNETETYQPHPVDNPLGFFYRSSALRLHNNVRIRGTLITQGNSQGDLHIYGQNVHLEPFDLPLYEGGASTVVQLPVAMVGDDLLIHGDARANIAGLVLVTREFRVDEGSQDASVSWTVTSGESALPVVQVVRRHLPQLSATEAERLVRAGCVKAGGGVAQLDTRLAAGQTLVVYPYVLLSRVVTRNVYVGGRWEWYYWFDWWDWQHDRFQAQQGDANGIRHFPAWVESREGLRAEPQLGIRPDPFAPRYHWGRDGRSPIYDFKDDQLRWELVRWIENPKIVEETQP